MITKSFFADSGLAVAPVPPVKDAEDPKPKLGDRDLIEDIKLLDKKIGDVFDTKVSELLEYAALAENYRDINDEFYRGQLFAKLSYGLRRSGECYAWALLQKSKASILRKETEAAVATSDLATWVSNQKEMDPKFKLTESSKKQYIHTVDSVKIAARTEAICEAMCENFAIMRTQFTSAISTLRAMCYGHRDSVYMSSTASAESIKNIND
jgi:hypothetical protein